MSDKLDSQIQRKRRISTLKRTADLDEKEGYCRSMNASRLSILDPLRVMTVVPRGAAAFLDLIGPLSPSSA